MTKKTIATQILERKFQKLSGVPGQPGVNAANSAPSVSPPSAPRSLGRPLPSPGLPKPLTDGLNTAGSAVWNNGGRQVVQHGLVPTAQFLQNSLHGISTAGIGAANTAAGGVGNVISGIGYGVGAGTDAAGLTNNAKGWVANNMWRHTNNAVQAGAKDFAGGIADTLSGGRYDYDGTFAGPEHSGTAVEQMRSGIRDELGRGSGFDTAFNAANAVGDFAANQAAFGGAGRGINVAARAAQGSQLAAPALNVAAKTPIVGAPAAATGRWLAGEAPAANMFQKGLVPYYRASGLQSVADDVYNAGNQIAQVTNPSDRTSDAREYQAQMAAATNEPPLQTQDTPYVDSVTYADPAARADLYSRALNQDTPQPDDTQAAQAQAQQPPESQSVFDPQRSPSAQIAKNDRDFQQQQAAENNLTPKFDATAAATKLEAAKTPEDQKRVIGEMAQGLKANLTGNDLAGAQHVIDGKFDTPEAKAFIDNQLGPAGDRFLKEQIGDNAADPNAFGQAMGMWNSLGTAGQIAFSVGVPLAILGMLGGSGITTLLGALGIGAAGIMGASGGLFGQDAQNSVNGMLGGLGQSLAPMLGINLPNEADIKTRLTAAAKQGPEQAQAELAKVRSEIEPYAKFSPDAQKFLTDSADPNYMYNQAQQYGKDNYAQLVDDRLRNPESIWDEFAAQSGLTGEAAARDGTWSRFFMGDPEKNIAKRLAQKGWVKTQSVNIMRKAARCWAGYEPVPGKKPYSNDSCRPIGSKKKKKKTEKKAVEGYTGAYSGRPFDVEHAAKMFKMPAKNPQLVYNRLMNTWKQNKFSPAQFSELRQKYDGLPPAFNTTTQTPVAPQPAPTAPQQAVKPAAPTASPSATPASPPSPATAPKPAPQNRPIMTQMTTQTGQPQPSLGATAYINSARGGRR